MLILISEDAAPKHIDLLHLLDVVKSHFLDVFDEVLDLKFVVRELLRQLTDLDLVGSALGGELELQLLLLDLDLLDLVNVGPHVLGIGLELSLFPLELCLPGVTILRHLNERLLGDLELVLKHFDFLCLLLARALELAKGYLKSRNVGVAFGLQLFKRLFL